MTMLSKIIVDEQVIADSLYIHDQKEYPYIVNRVSNICLTKFVELVFRNQFGDPLRLLPFQSVMLHMMWHKKFPMILACRGAGKCSCGSTLVQVSDGLYRFDELIDPSTPEMTEVQLDMDAIGENGPNKIGYGWNNGWRDTKKIRTSFGFECENTLEHKIRVLRDGEIAWVKSKDIQIGDIVPIVRTPFLFGKDNTLSEDQAWFLGATVGDGMVSQKSKVNLTNTDQDIVDGWCSIGEQWSGKAAKPRKHLPEYNIYSRCFNRLLNEDCGLEYAKAHDKQIPLLIRRSPREIVAAFLSGLFDADGGMTKRGFEYSTVSEELSRQVQTCLLAFGILSRRRVKQVKYKNKRNKAFVITIEGSNNLSLLRDLIGFRCLRKQHQLEQLCLQDANTNIDVIPHEYIQNKLLALSAKFRSLVTIGGHEYNKERKWLAPSRIKAYEISYNHLDAILEHTKEIKESQEWQDLKRIADQHYFFSRVTNIDDGYTQTYDMHIPNDHTFIANGFISHNTFMLAVFCLLKCLLIPGTKVVIVSGGFRQAKFTFHYIDMLIKNSPIIQEAIRKFYPGNDFGVKFATDKVYLKVGHNTEITGIPVGDGTKVRGMRATTLVCDEVASIDDVVFDTAIGPFLSVKADPAEAVVIEGFIHRLQELGANPAVMKFVEEARRSTGNQLILSGTATYQFSHFFRRYEAYNIFASSYGDPKKIKEGLRRQSRDGTLNVSDEMVERWQNVWHEYAVFRLPYYGMPAGFLDDDIVANHKAIMDSVIFGHEYECRFSKDTNGFFPRSIIDAASPGKGDPNECHFELYGQPHAQYVMGLDPARWNDNFGLVVMKLAGATAQTVYCESWNKAKWEESIKRIKDILARFPNIVYIACDKGGGGDTIQEMLASAKYLREGEQPIIEIEPSDEYKAIPNARRILEMVNFHTWSAPANHALKRDIIMKNVIFPGRLDDNIVLGNHSKWLLNVPEFDYEDSEHVLCAEHINDLLYGTENDEGEPISLGVYLEIEEMKNELCTIIQAVTEKGTETFGLQKLGDQPEGLDVRRRDRYSALLLASHAARVMRGHGFERGWGRAYGGAPQDILNNSKSGGFRPMNRRGGVAY